MFYINVICISFYLEEQEEILRSCFYLNRMSPGLILLDHFLSTRNIHTNSLFHLGKCNVFIDRSPRHLICIELHFGDFTPALILISVFRHTRARNSKRSQMQIRSNIISFSCQSERRTFRTASPTTEVIFMKFQLIWYVPSGIRNVPSKFNNRWFV